MKKRVPFDHKYEFKKNGAVVFTEPICQQIWYDKILSKVLTFSISLIVITFNTFLAYFIVYAVKKIHDDSVTVQQSRMMKALFISQFFNTSFIILLANANLSEHQPAFLTQYFKGPFSDYNP